jgi:metal-responsive CopG/Arc/MetJ family transcriptional regulator
VKTAISVPDELFEHADRIARAQGMSRSAFFARAVERYLQEVEGESLTGEIDAALERIGADESGSAAGDAGRRRLVEDSEDW